MKRRNFLKTLCTLPAVSLLPSLSYAEDSSNNGSDVVGLNKIIDIIKNDTRLNRRVDEGDIQTAIESAERMNEIIIEAILQTGVANDKLISTADTREINDYIFHNYSEEWKELHGDDEEGEETGFHLVVNDGAKTRLFGKNAINKVADSIYHLGFETHLKNRLLNEDGDKNATFKHVAEWLNELLKEDLEAGRLANSDITEVIGDTDTGLDQAVKIIYNDKGLQKRISTGDMRIGARSANQMSHLLLEAIEQTNAGATGSFTKDEIKSINRYLVENYANVWRELHGNDEDDEETGYHKVQNDGAKTKLFGKNAINRVFDGIFHLGFETSYKNRLVNEDGDKNTSFKRVASWLSELLADDLENQKEDLKILIPLYSYPDLGQENSIWQKLIDTKQNNPNIEIVAIINPNNGHFIEENSDFAQGIQELTEADIKVIGYVYTQYGNRETQDIVDDIEAYREFYKDDGVSGIFFDETSTDTNLLNYYSNLSSEARNRDLTYIILNPGMTTDQSYVDSGIANLIVSYENPNEELLTNPPETYNNPTKTTELSILIYEMEDDNVDDLIDFAREHKFSYIYFTEDGADGNPWDSISQYFEDEVEKALN